MDGLAQPRTRVMAALGWIFVGGPGLLVMLADTDAGNVVTGAQAGAQWGYRLLPLLLLLIPMLYMVQELTVRLGIYTGRGHGELIRERFGVGWAWLSTAGFAAATIGSLVTEFTGVAASENSMACRAASPCPSPRRPCSPSSPPAPTAAWSGPRSSSACSNSPFSPSPGPRTRTLETLAKDAVDLPLGNREFMYLVAAVIGATLQPMDDLLSTVRHCRQEASAR